MDGAGTLSNGGKRNYQRLVGGTGRVCSFWMQGRCTRNPCAFIHENAPSSSQKQDYEGVVSKRPQHDKRRTSGSLVWRNPNTNGGGTGGSLSTQDSGRGAPLGAEAGVASIVVPDTHKSPESICKFFVKGHCAFGEGCRFIHSWSTGDDFSLLTSLEGHQKVIRGIALPSGSNKLYSGSADGTARIWDCESGQCVTVAKLGGEVGCIINEGPWVLIGVPNAVVALNTKTGVEIKLDGPLGQVYALVVAGNNTLFAGVQDSNILAWKFSTEETCFQQVACLGGHQAAVVSLVVGAGRLYSGSIDHTIRMWDIVSLQCMQILTDHGEVVTSLLCWDQFLLSCSLDQTIKVWAATETGGLEVTYTHNQEHGVLFLAGMPDAHGKPVLVCSCDNSTVHLYELPSFKERGKIFSREEVTAFLVGPSGLFFTGDGTGELKVWKWLAEEAQTS